MRNWTDQQLEVFKEKYPHIRTDILAAELGKSTEALYVAAARLNIKKTVEYLQSAECGIFIKGSKKPSWTCYKKGHIPANKGKKMTPEVYEKAKNTMFKSGQLPKNTLYDGAETIRTEPNGKQYYWVRISQAVWRPKSHIEWEKVNGPIPKGGVIRHISPNTLDDSHGNLMLITKAQNMQENTIHRYPEEIKTTIMAITKLKKIIKKHEKQN